MKRIIALALIGGIVLLSGQFAYCRPGPGGRNHHGGGHHHSSWNDWDTVGAVCAGVLGVGLIAAAVSDWNRPVYRQPVAYYPPVSSAPSVTYQTVVITTNQPSYSGYPPVYGSPAYYSQYEY